MTPFRLAALHATARPGSPSVGTSPVSPSACALTTASPGFIAGDDFTSTVDGAEVEANVFGAGTNPNYDHGSGSWGDPLELDATVPYCGHASIHAPSAGSSLFTFASKTFSARNNLWTRQAWRVDSSFDAAAQLPDMGQLLTIGGVASAGDTMMLYVLHEDDGDTHPDGLYVWADGYGDPTVNLNDAPVSPATLTAAYQSRFCNQRTLYEVSGDALRWRVWLDATLVADHTSTAWTADGEPAFGGIVQAWFGMDATFTDVTADVWCGAWEVIDADLDADPYGLL